MEMEMENDDTYEMNHFVICLSCRPCNQVVDEYLFGQIVNQTNYR